MIQGGGNSGAEMQPPGLGMPMPPGSPTRLEAGQANGAEMTSPTGNVNAGAPGQAGVGILGTTAGNLVGAGTLVAGPSDAADDRLGMVLKGDKEVSWIQETTECMAKVAQGM